MTSDSLRSSREQSPYRDAYESRQSSQRSSTLYSDLDSKLSERSRASSNARMNGVNTTPPLHDTIHSAVRSTDAVSQVDPNLIAHISEQVTQNLLKAFKTSGIPAATPSPPPPPQPLQPEPVKRRRQSRSPADSIHRQFTPPSPDAQYGSPIASHRSPSPDSPEQMASDSSSYASHDMPRTSRRRESNPSPLRGEDTRDRPKPPRVPTAIHETSTLEKIWQPLFENGRPTLRLGEFLRGLAIHIIEDYEPKCSLVITPGKMLKFFRDVKQPDEIYPFHDIFGGKCTNLSISRMYRGLACQHHLVQLNHGDEPTIPGLTPYGFESWMTTLILAHPEIEFGRLAQAVLNMPISNADSRSERFPKELPRQLFPRDEDRSSQQKLWAVISADRNIQLRNSNPMPPPPAQPPLAQSTASNSSFMERERNPYSSTHTPAFSTTASRSPDDEEYQPPRVPIERERQPYTAREGTGKIFSDRERDRDSGPPTATRTSRSNSTAPSGSAYCGGANSSARPTDVPLSSSTRQHRSSMTGIKPNFAFPSSSPPSGAGAAGYGGPRNPYVRSEGANVNEIPREYYTSNIPAIDPLDDSSRRYVGRQKPTSEDGGHGSGSHRYSMPPPLRSNTSGSGGYEYSNGREARDSRDTREAYDPYEDRRRSAYTGAGAGTDGYGSYARGDSSSRY